LYKATHGEEVLFNKPLEQKQWRHPAEIIIEKALKK